MPYAAVRVLTCLQWNKIGTYVSANIIKQSNIGWVIYNNAYNPKTYILWILYAVTVASVECLFLFRYARQYRPCFTIVYFTICKHSFHHCCCCCYLSPKHLNKEFHLKWIASFYSVDRISRTANLLLRILITIGGNWRIFSISLVWISHAVRWFVYLFSSCCCCYFPIEIWHGSQWLTFLLSRQNNSNIALHRSISQAFFCLFFSVFLSFQRLNNCNLFIYMVFGDSIHILAIPLLLWISIKSDKACTL